MSLCVFEYLHRTAQVTHQGHRQTCAYFRYNQIKSHTYISVMLIVFIVAARRSGNVLKLRPTTGLTDLTHAVKTLPSQHCADVVHTQRRPSDHTAGNVRLHPIRRPDIPGFHHYYYWPVVVGIANAQRRHHAGSIRVVAVHVAGPDERAQAVTRPNGVADQRRASADGGVGRPADGRVPLSRGDGA